MPRAIEALTTIARPLVFLFTPHLILFAAALLVSAVLGGAPCADFQLPRPDHVLIVILENHGFDSIIGSPDAPYINELAAHGMSFTRSFGVTHPSQPNYLALFSGSTQNVNGNACPNDYSTPNLASSLIARGLTFAGFSEGLPGTGARLCTIGHYVRRHNPWANWQGAAAHAVPSEANLPWTSFPTDFSELPTVSIVIPNNQHNMHDGTDPARIREGDRWLRTNIASYVDWAMEHNSLFILTWDEDNRREGNRIPTLFVGPMVRVGQSFQFITHFNVLRTIQDFYQLSHSGQASVSDPIRDVWISVANPRQSRTNPIASTPQ
ncbi:acid phosphatase [Nitrospira sp.]|nr:acid phosphatase [Nitrospira sp.]